MQLGNRQKRLEIFTPLGGSQLLSGLTDAVRIGIASLNLFGGNPNLKFLEKMLTEHRGDRTRRATSDQDAPNPATVLPGSKGMPVNIRDRFHFAQKMSDRALRLTGMGCEVSGSMVRPGDACAA
jgi:hypothetical protein